LKAGPREHWQPMLVVRLPLILPPLAPAELLGIR
jgi:hypothetical protein